MYDNTVVENLNHEAAIKFMIDCNMSIGAVKNNIIFGNGTFKMDPPTNGLASSGSMYKQVCLSIDPVGVTGALDTVIAYYNQAPNTSIYSEVADALQFFIAQSAEANPHFVPSQADTAISQFTPVTAGRFIQLTIFQHFGHNGGNKYIIIDLAGRSVEDVIKEWKTLVAKTSVSTIGDTRMALYRLIQKAQYISGGNDQLIILNDSASIQYNVTVADSDEEDCWNSAHYAVLSVKGEKYYCSSETDLLTQFNRQLHLIEV